MRLARGGRENGSRGRGSPVSGMRGSARSAVKRGRGSTESRSTTQKAESPAIALLRVFILGPTSLK
jgi:hypothetical protein